MKIKRTILLILIALIFIGFSKVYATEFNTTMEDENIGIETNIIEENENIKKDINKISESELNSQLDSIFETKTYSLEEFANVNTENSEGIVELVTKMASIVSSILIFFSILFILIGIMRIIKNKKSEKKKHVVIWFVVSGLLFLVNGILDIMTNFAKPIIYLYPEKEEDVEVKLGYPEKITCSYPKYKDSWKVTAKPNGDLVNKENGRKLYSLYWEGKKTIKHDLKEGFIVKGEDASNFLEEKLAILGLNEREAEEFILYWLPKLESNQYNFIKFETKERIDKDMPLEITPKPDTVIRVVMAYKKILKPYEVKEQILETPERKGFTVVEWGGTKI